ncbi:MAG TPA: N-acetylmuramoyl-L-alanine amidase [Actinomycetota bacterium]|nr:N-acetylmuramoyl-L-alanine amidase [Actinomycetota bacterium]
MNKVIRPEDRSEEVADVQTRLRGLGLSIDDEPGHFGRSTTAAVRAFQQRRSMLVDGLVGPQTWSALVEASWRLGDRTLYVKHPPMRGDDVATLQSRLNALGFDAGREDGIFGPLAYKAVRAFQREYGIAEDGMFGARTHTALQGLRVDRPGTAARLREELRHRHGRGVNDVTVTIDPGHGGDDHGAEGNGGLQEAEFCWELATLLAERLVAAGARVRFTRTEPENPSASERAERANEIDADIFLSLHLNSNEERTAEGASAYHFGTSQVGEALAEAIHAELLNLGARDCRIHDRSFAILKETRMPAVMIEPAFITNPDEEKRLQEPEHRAAIADAIAAGIKRFYATASALRG